ncbi:MAG: hypothetical protein LQ352_005011 [Teloschistes flavicans]|nr:MAG: hypothetical protein LQ352_005011 [Teloschistes flavicans]
MPSTLTDSSNLMPAVTASFNRQTSRQKIQIVPAIPRKLEQKPRNSSGQTTVSTSAPRTHAQQSPHVQQTLHPPHNDVPKPKEEVAGPEPAGAAAVESRTYSRPDTANGRRQSHSGHPEPMVAADASISSALDPLSPCFVPQPSNITGYHPETIPYSLPATPTETVEATSSSVSDPRNFHPFHPVPTTSTSPGEPVDMMFEHHDNIVDSVQSTSPTFAYPIQPINPWTPSQTTPPEDSGYSPTRQPYHTYTQAASYGSQPTLASNYEVPTSGVDYGYSCPSQFSFYRHSYPSHFSASPVQSSYEGYTIGNSSHVVRPQTNSPSRQRHSIATGTPGAPCIRLSHSQYGHAMPQFGSHLPITPSATPPNSGNRTQGSPPKESPQPNVPTEQPVATPSYDQDSHYTDLSSEFKERCKDSLRFLEDIADVSTCPYALANHLLDSFNDPAFADCELYITHVSHRFEPTVVSLHSLLIAQNPVLNGLLQTAEIREDGKRQVLLKVRDQYADPAAIKIGLKVCYGETPARHTAYPGELAAESEISTAWMDSALALAAAGHVLDMMSVANRGEQIASMIIDWHNLERALAFAMDSGVQKIWGSSNGPSDFPSNSGKLLQSCLDFVISNVSENFCLDLEAKSLASIDRLPPDPESQPQTSRSRLSRIQFGELPSELEESTSKHDSLASSILLSLSFPHLKFILDGVPLAINQKNIKLVIEEREQRRARSLNAQTDATQATEGIDLTLTQQERIVVNDGEEEGRLTVERS